MNKKLFCWFYHQSNQIAFYTISYPNLSNLYCCKDCGESLIEHTTLEGIKIEPLYPALGPLI